MSLPPEHAARAGLAHAAPHAAPQGARPAAAPAALSPPVVLSKPSDRRESGQPSDRQIGRVTFCNGARAAISTRADNETNASADAWSVGRLVSISTGKARVVALIYEIKTDRGVWSDNEINTVTMLVELVGEVADDASGRPVYKRGVSVYPGVGALAHRIRAGDLEAIHDLGARRAIRVGHLSQNDSIPACVGVDDMLSRHFAVVGTTGVGKSSAVSLIVRRCLEADERLRVVMLDPHNEYAASFGETSVRFDAANLALPAWLFRFDEMEDIVFRGRDSEDESEILREFIAQAKAQFMGERAGAGLSRRASESLGLTADTPTPYRFSDVFKQIDDMIGSLEPRFDRARLRSLRVRLEMLIADPRFSFLFAKGAADAPLADILARLFRLPAEGKPVSVVNLAGLPSEVVNSVVSVLARLSFEVAHAAEGGCRVLLVCEEAHRYVPQDAALGFAPTRRAIGRIAKEGRKYGCAIGVVTQRPGELDPTILSQCSTVFAMRLANDRDQEIIRSAIADSSASTISFLSALDNQEAIAFGEGVAAPMRLRFERLTSATLPSASADRGVFAAKGPPDAAALAARLRGGRPEKRPEPPPAPATPPAPRSLHGFGGKTL